MSVTMRSDGARRVDVGAARDVLLQDVVLDGAREPSRAATPCRRATATYSASRTIAVALIVIDVDTRSSGMPSNSSAMSSIESIATPTRPTSPAASAMVRVVADLRRQIEGDAQAGDALVQQVAVAAVRLGGRAEAGVLAHRPEPAAVHGRLDAARERELAREADVGPGLVGGTSAGEERAIRRHCQVGDDGPEADVSPEADVGEVAHVRSKSAEKSDEFYFILP